MTIVRNGAREAFEEYLQDQHDVRYPDALAYYSDEQIRRALLETLTLIFTPDPNLHGIVSDDDPLWYGLGIDTVDEGRGREDDDMWAYPSFAFS